jgi:hypothetical protein
MPIGVNNFLTVPYSNESSTAETDGTRGVGTSKINQIKLYISL